MKKRVTYRPGKAQGVFGLLWGGVFVLIGLCLVIPTFGMFGILWTLLAAVMTAYQGYLAFGKQYAGPEIHIEEEGEHPPSHAPSQVVDSGYDQVQPEADIGLSAKARLEQLQSLKQAGLVTDQEFEQKRQEILRDL